MTPAEDVDMEVIDGLAAVGTGVDDQPIAVVEVVDAGDLAGFGEQGTEQSGVGRQCMGVGRDVALGDEQDVYRGLRMDVGKGEGVAGLVKALGGDGARHDFAEEAVGRGLVWHVAYGKRSMARPARLGRRIRRRGACAR